MVCFNHDNSSLRSQNGSGVIDTILKPFTYEKYKGEHHSYSLDPNHFLQGYSYVGPGTNVKLRDQLGDNKPLNDLDRFAEAHDRLYIREKEEYEQDHDKQKHINNIWHGDDQFVRNAKQSHDDPVMGKIASKLIEKKEKLEKSGLLDFYKFLDLELFKTMKKNIQTPHLK